MNAISSLLRLLLGALLALLAQSCRSAEGSSTTEVHYAFSRKMFASLNENDAKAALKAYSKLIAEQNNISVGDLGPILANTDEMADILRKGQADVISLTAEEYFSLEGLGLEGPIILSKKGSSYLESYVVLTRQESSILKVEQLRGKSVEVLDDLDGSLAPVWLELLCREHGLGPAEQALERIIPSQKVSAVVLPVFFGKVDACVVTKAGWEVMGELNPQVKNQLRVVATSPDLVPIVVSFRKGFPLELRERIVRATERAASKPTLQQVLAIFRSDGISQHPLSVLDSTRQLISAYHKLNLGPVQRDPAQVDGTDR